MKVERNPNLELSEMFSPYITFKNGEELLSKLKETLAESIKWGDSDRIQITTWSPQKRDSLNSKAIQYVIGRGKLTKNGYEITEEELKEDTTFKIEVSPKLHHSYNLWQIFTNPEAEAKKNTIFKK